MGEVKVSVDSGQTMNRNGTVSLSELELRLGEHEHGGVESKSWVGSIFIHLIAIIIFSLVFAPADFGGVEKHEIVLLFRHDDGEGNSKGAEVENLLEPEPIKVAAEETLMEEEEAPLADEVSLLDPTSVATEGADAGGSKSDDIVGPRGTFFGIEATGHEIVYIIDKSGSMKNRRLQRAIAELNRSIDGLKENQSYYVFLYSSKTQLLFGELVAKPIKATTANKLRTKQWLASVQTTGGTDPRESLARAIRLSPSAVFMLSDGKFDDPQKCRKSILSPESDAFNIVAGSLFKPPIHTIAFEDIDSCENMKRLARLSGGQYRFVGNPDNDSATEMLVRGQSLIEKGQFGYGMSQIRRVAKEYRETEAGWQAREILAKRHITDAQKYLGNSEPQKARQEFLAAVQLDPNGVVSGQEQQQLINLLIKQAENSENQRDRDEVLSMLTNIIQRHGQQSRETVMARVQPFVRFRLDDALRLEKIGKNVEAIQKLLALKHSLADGELREQINQAETRVAGLLLGNLSGLRRAQGDSGYGTLLERMSTDCNDDGIRGKAREALVEYAKEWESTFENLGKWTNEDTTSPKQVALTQTPRSDGRPIALVPGFDALRSPAADKSADSKTNVDEITAMRAYFSVIRERHEVSAEATRLSMEDVVKKYPSSVAARRAKDYLNRNPR